MDEAQPYSSCHYLDALVQIGLLHDAVMSIHIPAMEDTIWHIWKEGGHHKDLFDSVPLQPSNAESNLVQAHFNEYESMNSQIST